MYKKALSGLLLANLLLLFGFICVWGVEKSRNAYIPAYETKMNKTLVAEIETSTLGILPVAASGQRVVDYNVLEKETAYDLMDEDLDVLMRIVEAEAGTEDIEGKLLVANVVLNRVNSEKFPDSVTEVVFQREKGVSQFSPISDGRFWEVKISEETTEAVERALEGEDISQGALYFAARKYADSDRMRWFDENLTFLFEHGGHEFFGE